MPNAISTVTFLDVNVTEFTNLSKPILFTAVHDTIPTKTESTILTIHHLIKSDKSTFRPSPSRVLAEQTCTQKCIERIVNLSLSSDKYNEYLC